MIDKQLSKNFKLSEFTYSKTANKHIKPTDFQIEMLKQLCVNLLQPIRDKFGSMKITSGLRDKEVYDALVKAGYPASKTSDHFLVPYLVKKGKVWLAPADAPNPRGKGAADFMPLKADIWDVYCWVMNNFKASTDFNQLIIYPAAYSNIKRDFIHISNPARLFIAKYIIPSTKPLLVCVKGNKKFAGKTYVSLEYFKDRMGRKFRERSLI